MTSDPDAPPVNPLPVGVVILALPMVILELAFLAGSEGIVGGPEAVGWRLATIERYAFFVPLFQFAQETGQWVPEILVRLLTYPFMHWGFTHMLMALVFLLALGKMVGEVMGSRAVLLIFFGASILGALALTVLTNDQQPLIGGFPGAYGLIGAYSFLLWMHARLTGGPTHQAFTLIAFLMGIQLLWALLFGAGQDWIADLAGFAGGFLLSFVVSPGGWRRVLGLLRQR
ncbi:MAG: rhomboid family intramembrane serine protease [Pseudomonadota bacterium]